MQKYLKFFAMIATSTVVMFGLMYLNTYVMGHIYFSETRAYMALYMGAAMAVVMLVFMWSMYPEQAANLTDLRVSALAKGIIKAQREEIDEMKALVEELERK